LVAKWYDAHIHFFYSCSKNGVLPGLKDLEEKGLAGFDALIFAEIPTETETILTMVPGAYHKNITSQALEHQKDPFALIKQAAPLKIIPFADARFVRSDAHQKVQRFKQMGFQGIKFLYVPEEESELQIGGMEKAFGRPVKESEAITALLIDGASSHGMLVLFHADLRKYGGFVEEMVRSHPKTNFNIPHFGSSRKLMSVLMDRYSNCYTDVSSLPPFMQRDPSSYRDFVTDYQGRILFGSDGVLSRPEDIESALEFLRKFLDEDEVFDKLVRRNFLTFHHLPEDGPSV
jgi:predicted TIM-barrel fold metal-dependent hydrolase